MGSKNKLLVLSIFLSLAPDCNGGRFLPGNNEETDQVVHRWLRRREEILATRNRQEDGSLNAPFAGIARTRQLDPSTAYVYDVGATYRFDPSVVSLPEPMQQEIMDLIGLTDLYYRKMFERLYLGAFEEVKCEYKDALNFSDGMLSIEFETMVAFKGDDVPSSNDVLNNILTINEAEYIYDYVHLTMPGNLMQYTMDVMFNIAPQTIQPSMAPTISSQPTISSAPSQAPSVSLAPSISAAPSTKQNIAQNSSTEGDRNDVGGDTINVSPVPSAQQQMTPNDTNEEEEEEKEDPSDVGGDPIKGPPVPPTPPQAAPDKTKEEEENRSDVRMDGGDTIKDPDFFHSFGWSP